MEIKINFAPRFFRLSLHLHPMKFVVLRLSFFLLLFLSVGANAYAQQHTDTSKVALADSFHVHYFTGDFFQQATQKDSYTLTNFEKYDHRNYLGNIGQAINDYYGDQPIGHVGFNYFKNDFARNLSSDDSIRYYDVHHPYTKLFFLAGQNREAEFSFTHSQNVNKNLNFTAFFNRVRSDGTYLNQSTNLTSVWISSNYKSPNKRYYLLGDIIYNVDKPEVNGGIKADTAFESGFKPTNNQLIPVNLNDAQRRYRNRVFSLRQFFNMGYNSISADSTQKSTFVPTSAFFVNFRASDDAITYADDSTGNTFYQHSYPHNQALYHDSVYFYKLTSSIGWNTWASKGGGKTRPLGFYIQADNEITRINQVSGDTAMVNWIAKAGLFNYTDSASGFKAKLTGEYAFMGYNAGDYLGNLNAEKALFHHKLYLGFKGFASLKKPDYMTQNYNSVHFVWRNNFVKEGLNEAKFYITAPRSFFELGAFARQYQNLVFYGAEATPLQLNSERDLLGVYIFKAINLGNWTLNGRVTYQYSSDVGVLQFPEWIGDGSLYYHSNIKKILYYQAGVDVFYYSSYYGQLYMPATGEFYTQLDKQTGNYPFCDVFVSIQIKTVRLFVKYENVNSGYPSSAYYLATHYPAPDRSLKLGLTWIFNN